MTTTSNSDSQASVLDLVRSALGRSVTLLPAPLEPFVERSEIGDGSGLTARFIQEATGVRAQVHRVSDERQIVGKIAELCASQNGEVAISRAELFREMDLPGNLVARGLSIFADHEADHERLTARLAKCGVGVTAADYAIAETGTLVLSSDEQNALLVSLLPPIHIAVVRSEQMIASIDQAISRINNERMTRADPTRSISMITGPSRTSDVELVLSIGVHGPKELHVIILEM